MLSLEPFDCGSVNSTEKGSAGAGNQCRERTLIKAPGRDWVIVSSVVAGSDDIQRDVVARQDTPMSTDIRHGRKDMLTVWRRDGVHAVS